MRGDHLLLLDLGLLTPLQGFYENVGGVGFDVEGAWNGDGFGLGMIGLAGDVQIVFLRGGYQYDGVEAFHKPGLGFGLDDGKVSLDYGVQFYFKTLDSHWHS